jgi:hypothetical protein
MSAVSWMFDKKGTLINLIKLCLVFPQLKPIHYPVICLNKFTYLKVVFSLIMDQRRIRLIK